MSPKILRADINACEGTDSSNISVWDSECDSDLTNKMAQKEIPLSRGGFEPPT